MWHCTDLIGNSFHRQPILRFAIFDCLKFIRQLTFEVVKLVTNWFLRRHWVRELRMLIRKRRSLDDPISPWHCDRTKNEATRVPHFSFRCKRVITNPTQFFENIEILEIICSFLFHLIAKFHASVRNPKMIDFLKHSSASLKSISTPCQNTD
jgi:hypothetical protein